MIYCANMVNEEKTTTTTKRTREVIMFPFLVMYAIVFASIVPEIFLEIGICRVAYVRVWNFRAEQVADFRVHLLKWRIRCGRMVVVCKFYLMLHYDYNCVTCLKYQIEKRCENWGCILFWRAEMWYVQCLFEPIETESGSQNALNCHQILTEKTKKISYDPKW